MDHEPPGMILQCPGCVPSYASPPRRGEEGMNEIRNLEIAASWDICGVNDSTINVP